jgi:hypothetical protein
MEQDEAPDMEDADPIGPLTNIEYFLPAKVQDPIYPPLSPTDFRQSAENPTSSQIYPQIPTFPTIPQQSVQNDHIKENPYDVQLNNQRAYNNNNNISPRSYSSDNNARENNNNNNNKSVSNGGPPPSKIPRKESAGFLSVSGSLKLLGIFTII